jgi:chaperonin GroEL (HSP60 family)
MFENNVIEPVSVKQQIINSATECACMLLRIDDVIPSKRQGSTHAPARRCRAWTDSA